MVPLRSRCVPSPPLPLPAAAAPPLTTVARAGQLAIEDNVIAACVEQHMQAFLRLAFVTTCKADYDTLLANCRAHVVNVDAVRDVVRPFDVEEFRASGVRGYLDTVRIACASVGARLGMGAGAALPPPSPPSPTVHAVPRACDAGAAQPEPR